MGNTTEEYISIYDNLKKARGRSKTCKLSDEEEWQRLRANYQAHFNANPEKERERVRLAMARKRAEANTNRIQKTIFLGFLKKTTFNLNT